MLQNIDDDYRAADDHNDDQQQGHDEQDLKYLTPEDRAKNCGHDNDRLYVSYSTGAAVKCVHCYASPLLRAIPGAAPVVRRPPYVDRACCLIVGRR
jgi:hypothetical protein